MLQYPEWTTQAPDRNAESRLRKSHLQLEATLNALPDLLLDVDVNGQILDCRLPESKWKNMFPEVASGIQIHAVFSKEAVRIITSGMQQAETTGLPQSGAFFVDTEAGQFRIETSIVVKKSVDTPNVSFIILCRDVTRRWEAEQEKLRIEDRLRMAERLESVGLLAGGVTHDFNNLLMGVMGHISLLKISGALSPSQLTHITDIESLVNRASGLTRQLLGFARAGKSEVKPIRLDELMRATADMFGRTHKEISIRHEYPADIWQTSVDQGQIDQVLINLFVNAAKAMPHGGHLVLKADNVTLNETQGEKLAVSAGNYVRMTVQDTGIGIPADVLPRIFDPFFTTRDAENGSGLGLASAYGIIKNHDGAIEVQSEPGKGACFTIYTPAVSCCTASEPVTVPPLSEVTGSGAILLVDDEETIQEVVKLMLEHLGYTVITAASGRKAVQIYRERSKDIDLVILDMVMPGMMGDETFQKLKAIDPGVRVLLSSGFSQDDYAEQLLRKGCLGFIQKPFQMNVLSHKIGNLLRGGGLSFSIAIQGDPI